MSDADHLVHCSDEVLHVNEGSAALCRLVHHATHAGLGRLPLLSRELDGLVVTVVPGEIPDVPACMHTTMIPYL
jgi:hypothetical protein